MQPFLPITNRPRLFPLWQMVMNPGLSCVQDSGSDPGFWYNRSINVLRRMSPDPVRNGIHSYWSEIYSWNTHWKHGWITALNSVVACDIIEGTWRRSGQSSSEVIDYCWIYTEHSDIHIWYTINQLETPSHQYCIIHAFMNTSLTLDTQFVGWNLLLVQNLDPHN